MEITLQTRLAHLSSSIRVAFWRSISTCIAAIIRAPRNLRVALISLSIFLIAGVAFTLGRAAGNLLTTHLP